MTDRADLLARLAELERRIAEIEDLPRQVSEAFERAAAEIAGEEASPVDAPEASLFLTRVSREAKATVQRVTALQAQMRLQAAQPPSDLQLALRARLRERLRRD